MSSWGFFFKRGTFLRSCKIKIVKNNKNVVNKICEQIEMAKKNENCQCDENSEYEENGKKVSMVKKLKMENIETIMNMLNISFLVICQLILQHKIYHVYYLYP